MPKLVYVSFNPIKQVYQNIEKLNIRKKDFLVISTMFGDFLAEVLNVADEFVGTQAINALAGDIKAKATTQEIKDYQKNIELEKNAIIIVKKILSDLDINMNIVSVKYSLCLSNLVVFFSSEKKIDFRELLKELNNNFKAKIRLENIGDPRLAASFIGGHGICGIRQCCEKKDTKYLEISKSQIKNQNLSPNPIKHLGNCNKLRCCLSFENDMYSKLKQALPKKGSFVVYEKKKWQVVDHNILKQEIVLERKETNERIREVCSADRLEDEN